MRFALLAVLSTAAPAAAHKLNVVVSPGTDPRRLVVVATYDGGEPADGATAVVRDGAGIESGRTTLDAAGAGDLPWPAGGWVVTVDDGAGHRASVRSDERGSGESPSRWFALGAGLILIGVWTRWRRRMRSVS